jgi:hypothetical protein
MQALYCLKQNPEIAQLIEAGQYDPVKQNRLRIARLQKANQGKQRRPSLVLWLRRCLETNLLAHPASAIPRKP